MAAVAEGQPATHRVWWCRSAPESGPPGGSSDSAGPPPALQSAPASSSGRAASWPPPRRSAARVCRTLAASRRHGHGNQSTNQGGAKPIGGPGSTNDSVRLSLPAFLAVRYIIFFFFFPVSVPHRIPKRQPRNTSSCTILCCSRSCVQLHQSATRWQHWLFFHKSNRLTAANLLGTQDIKVVRSSTLCLSFCLSVCLSVCLSACLSRYLI